MTAPRRHTLRSHVFLPGGLLAIAALGALALFFPGATAGAQTSSSRVSSNALIRSCGVVNTKGVTSIPNTGNPFKSDFLRCSDGHIVSYGNSAIVYSNPPTAYVNAGKLLFAQTMALLP